MYRILIAENEPFIAEFIKKGLRANGYAVEIEFNGYKTLLRISKEMYDLLILDLELPDKNGLEIIEELRGQGETLPIIIVSRRTDIRDKVLGFEKGADDYLTKPFRFEELLARTRARLRSLRSASCAELFYDHVLQVANVEMNIQTRQVRVSNRLIDLSIREFTLAELFLRYPGQILSREQLLSHVWGYDYSPGSNIVDVYVGYLRKKLGKDLIKTVRGIGYCLKG